ncbi:hypothetical protein ACQPYE_13750 [Actinosynnema sp. CA-299493]
MGKSITVTFHKGINEGDEKKCDVEEGWKLTRIRADLEGDGFLPPDKDEEVAYRFVNPNAKDVTKGQAVISRDLEEAVSLEYVLHSDNVMITNVKAARTDWVGISKDWLQQGRLAVRVRLNDNDQSAKDQNQRVGAFRPLMLSNVVPTSTKVIGAYTNLCAVVADSVVTFDLSSKTKLGFEFTVRPEQGDAIASSLFLCSPGDEEHWVTGSLGRYQSVQKTIQITGQGSKPPKDEILALQKVIFTSRAVTRYRDASGTYPPNQIPGDAEPTGMIPEGSTKPGKPTPGAGSEQKFGWIADVTTDPWDQALGQVVVYFFVFRDWETAKKVIEGYNTPPPDSWM